MINTRGECVQALFVCLLVSLASGQAEPLQPPETAYTEGPVFETSWRPPLVLGGEAHEKGLLADVIEGMTFEYREDDLRLLGVREGRISKNGGPTGDVWFLQRGGAPGPTFYHVRQDKVEPLATTRLAMSHGGYGLCSDAEGMKRGPNLSYRLTASDKQDDRILARVTETLRGVRTPNTRGFVRAFGFQSKCGSLRIALDVLGPGGGSRLAISDGPPKDSDWSLCVPGRAESRSYAYGGHVQVVIWSRPPGLHILDGMVVVDLEPEGPPLRFEVATFVLPEWSEEFDREVRQALLR